MRRLTVTAVPMFALLLASAGCGSYKAASYPERMKYLDEMSAKGIEYRGQLQRQGTEPSEKACGIGFDLLHAQPPRDGDGWVTTDTWSDQVREAYMKSCMTGAARPKPDANGVKAVTPVPFISSPAPARSS